MWGGWGDDFKHHLVGWDKACTPIANAGLDKGAYYLQSSSVGEVSAAIWGGGYKIMEACSSCEVWKGVGWLVYKTHLRHTWMWLVD